MADVEIRAADPGRDGEAVAAIYEPYVRESPATFEETPPTAAEMSERIRRVSLTHRFLVADDAGHVVAYAYGCPHRERASYRWSADVAVYVAPSQHRRGLGAALYRRLIPMLEEQGYITLYAGIVVPNAGSVGLHESFGFRPRSVYPAVGYKLGAWRDVGWWERRSVTALPTQPPEPLKPGAS